MSTSAASAVLSSRIVEETPLFALFVFITSTIYQRQQMLMNMGRVRILAEMCVAWVEHDGEEIY